MNLFSTIPDIFLFYLKIRCHFTVLFDDLFLLLYVLIRLLLGVHVLYISEQTLIDLHQLLLKHMFQFLVLSNCNYENQK